MALLTLTNAHLAYGHVPLLDRADLAVEPGRVVPVDPLDDGDLELVAGPPGAVELHELGFE